MKRRDCVRLAKLACQNDRVALIAALRGIVGDGDAARVNSWAYHAKRLADWLADDMAGAAPFSVFARGNSKLPFFAFSALPFVTCPGMGACAKFCYSLRAWRYPAAFFRQLQNTWLMGRSYND